MSGTHKSNLIHVLVGVVLAAFLLLGAGARAESGNSGRLGFNAGETLPVDLFGGRLTAADLIWQTRRLSIPDDAIINIGITEANKASIRYQRPIVPGLGVAPMTAMASGRNKGSSVSGGNVSFSVSFSSVMVAPPVIESAIVSTFAFFRDASVERAPH